MFRPIFHKQLISCIDEIESAECRIANPGMVLIRALFTFFVQCLIIGILCHGIFIIPGIFFIVCALFYGYLLIRLGRVMEKKLKTFLPFLLGLAAVAVAAGFGLRVGVVFLWDKFGWHVMQLFS